MTSPGGEKGDHNHDHLRLHADTGGSHPRGGRGDEDARLRRRHPAAGVEARQWTPRELRHSFVSLLSDSGVPIEEISRLVGHRSTVVTEVVYRKQLRPVLESGATVMDRLFAAAKDEVGGQFGGQDPSGTDEPGSLAEGTGL